MVESQGDVVPVGAGVARHRPDRYPDGAFAGRDRRTEHQYPRVAYSEP